jgi:hypothetical protein
VHRQEVHKIGSIDGVVNAEDGVGTWFSPALDATVLNVVDDEAGTVQQLDESSNFNGFLFELMVEEIVD